MKTKKMALSAILISLALVLSYVEKFIPALVAVPGVKVGLANITVVFALYKLGTKEAFIISLFRVFLAGLLFGTFISLAYSLAGALVSLTVMSLLKKASVFSPVAISVVGGVFHNMAQIVVACLIVGSDILKYYAPVLVLTGIVAGIAVGLVSSSLIKRINVE